MRHLSLVVVTLPMLCAPALSAAWVQTTTCIDEPAPAPTSTPFCTGNEVPRPFSWPRWTVRYRIHVEGSASFNGEEGLDDDLRETIQTAVEVWNEPDCSDFQFVYAGETEVGEHDPDDGLNVVAFQSEAWPYASSSLAITSVTARLDGTIIDADLELNEAENEFGLVERDGEEVWDLPNTVTHEAGHMLGLDHTDVEGATMEFDTRPGETEKRDLADDDVEGLCTIYPAGEEPEPPEDDDGEGCCTSTTVPVRAGWFPGLIMAAAACSMRVRDRRRRGGGGRRDGELLNR